MIGTEIGKSKILADLLKYLYIFLFIKISFLRYIQLKQFCGPDVRIYRQCAHITDDLTPAELIESSEGFEYREGPITVDKVFKDIWEVGEKCDSKLKKKKSTTKANNKKVIIFLII